ncbi:MAG: PqqD family peptide modification chaperone [Chitinophagaceae bacterium]|nr:PqqD family peptide modification chaperone [Chitinophagaceae bacterium]
MERFIQNNTIVQSKIGEEVVMLDMESGFYFGLNSVASVIWGLLADEIGFETLIDRLMEQFDVERSICEVDTQELLDQMLEKNIIRKVA